MRDSCLFCSLHLAICVYFTIEYFTEFLNAFWCWLIADVIDAHFIISITFPTFSKNPLRSILWHVYLIARRTKNNINDRTHYRWILLLLLLRFLRLIRFWLLRLRRNSYTGHIQTPNTNTAINHCDSDIVAWCVSSSFLSCSRFVHTAHFWIYFGSARFG